MAYNVAIKVGNQTEAAERRGPFAWANQISRWLDKGGEAELSRKVVEEGDKKTTTETVTLRGDEDNAAPTFTLSTESDVYAQAPETQSRGFDISLITNAAQSVAQNIQLTFDRGETTHTASTNVGNSASSGVRNIYVQV